MIEYIVALGILLTLFLCCIIIRPLRRIRGLMIKTASGLTVLLAITVFGGFFGVSVGVNLFTASAAVLLGVPGAVGILAVSMLL